MARCLITGITGFVAPHLAKLLLEDGHEVHGLVRHANCREYDLLDVLTVDELANIEFKYADLKDFASVRSIVGECMYDGIFHLAAQSHPPTSFRQPMLTFKDNIIGTANLIQAVATTQLKGSCHFHFCSTSEVYGNDGKEVGTLHEELPLHPINPYGVSKAASDLYMQERIRNEQITGFITRAFSHTGPRRGRNFSISSDAFQLADMTLNDKKSRVLKIGNLETERVVIDVRDCALAYYMLMLSHASGVYNVCGSDVHKMQYYTDLLIKESGLTDVKQKIHQPYYRPIDIQVQVGDCSKLKAQTGWTPKIPIKTTMRDLFNYWVKKLNLGTV